MTTNPTILGRTSALHSSAAAMPVAGADALSILTRGLATALMDGWSATSPTLTVQRVGHRPQGLAAAVAVPRRTVDIMPPMDSPAGALDRLQRTSGLTFDEIAEVLGISRRTLHNWKNGSAVSAPNERRLRDVDHAIATIAPHVGSVRDAIQARRAEGVRVFDLLAEGRFEAAVAMATGRSSTSPVAGAGEFNASLAARLDPAGPIEPVGSARVVKRPIRRKHR